jgi:hypothetical protein
MRPFGTYRSAKHLVYFVRCAVVLFGFIWCSHIPAFPLQNDMPASAAIAQPMAMPSCQTCAFCYMGPPFADHNAATIRISVLPLLRCVLFRKRIEVIFSDMSDVPAVALRLLYCRWLN